MDVRVVYGIRDAKGLTTNEKVFLYTVASHNEGMYATHDKNYKAMSLSKATYYRVRESLMDKKLIAVQRLMDAPTVYTVNKEVLDGWNESQTETDQSHSETDESLCETPESHCAETKVNLKGNSKENSKGNTTSVADAPSVTLEENRTNKEDQPQSNLIALDRSVVVQGPPQPVSHSETLPTGPADEEIERWIAERRALKEAART